MSFRFPRSVVAVLPLAFWGLVPLAQAAEKTVPVDRSVRLSRDRLRAHLKFLASDLLEGRGPGQRGGDLAAAYIAAEFERMGLEPAGEKGSYFQNVELIGVTPKPAASNFRVMLPGGERTLEWRDEIVGPGETQNLTTNIAAEIVFTGHSALAPEEKWDDFKGADLKGKVFLMLVDDPPPTAEEPGRFGGKARTYYGRWTYKLEMARKMGAVAALLVHTKESAGYGWQVVRNSWSGEDKQAPRKDGEARLGLSAWVAEQPVREIFKGAGLDFDEMRRKAGRRDFRPVPLGIEFRAHVECSGRKFETANVMARLPGSDPKRKGEAVVVTSHYDHFGVGEPDAKGDRIYNGAVDNAAGAAALLELAEAMAAEKVRPARSVIFFATACEEGGLNGSEWYVDHPTWPLEKTAVVVNLDSPPYRGEVEEVLFMGANRLDSAAEVERLAAHFDVRPVPDPAPEQGSFYRSDHFPFVKKGVPAINVKAGRKYRGKDRSFGDTLYEQYESKDYHQPSDEYDPAWELSGTAQIGEVIRRLVVLFANRPVMPAWKAGDEFEAARKAGLARAAAGKN